MVAECSRCRIDCRLRPAGHGAARYACRTTAEANVATAGGSHRKRAFHHRCYHDGGDYGRGANAGGWTGARGNGKNHEHRHT